MDGERLDQTIRLVEDASFSRRKAIALSHLGLSLREETIPLKTLTHLLSKLAKQEYSLQCFPYSRHSSYDELCYFISAFNPVDVYPCVTHEESRTSGTYIEKLFGKLCSGSSFSYDEDVRLVRAKSGRPACEHSSSKEAHQRLESSPERVVHNSDSVLDPASGLPSLDPLEQVDSEIPGVTPSSSNSNKRRGIPCSSPRKKNQTTTRKRLQEPTEGKHDHAVARTFSSWLECSGMNSDPSGRPRTELAEDSNTITILHAKRTSASSARVSANGGGGYTPPLSRAMRSQDRPSSWDKRHRRPEAKDTARPHYIPASKDISTGVEPRVSSGGTLLIPIALSDVSKPETEAGVAYDLETWPDNPAERATYSSPDLKTQLSAVQSTSGPQALDSADFVPMQSQDPHRVQYGRDAYEWVKSDDGYAWGRDCGLLSTVMGREDDEVEL
ncbi:MAG: hypothetical protein Q9196_000050 [Gyalolechia fulgens]